MYNTTAVLFFLLTVHVVKQEYMKNYSDFLFYCLIMSRCTKSMQKKIASLYILVHIYILNNRIKDVPCFVF